MDDKLIVKMIIMILAAFAMLSLMFFLPAGTIYFWQAWVYLVAVFTGMLLIMIYLWRHDPALIEKRLQMGEKEKSQKLIMKIIASAFLLLFLIPGFDFRYGWSAVPTGIVITADLVFLLGYYLFFLTLKENSYGSRLIEIQKGQKVISSGPYAYIRHPMYLAMSLMFGSTPLCLGSYWCLLVLIPAGFALIFRILNEEKVLAKGLPGYIEYLQKTKYRLIPGIW